MQRCLGWVAVALVSTSLSGRAYADHAGAPEKGAFLSSSRTYSEEVAKTMVSMQSHVRAVSAPEAATIPARLGAKGFQLVGSVIEGGGLSGARAYVAFEPNSKSLVVAFRGTMSDKPAELVSNALTDANAKKSAMDFVDVSSPHARAWRDVQVHTGFLREYGRLREAIAERVKRHPNARIWVTGHSLGGALATLGAVDLVANHRREVVLYTSGSPRVGGSDFRAAFDATVPTAFRVALQLDLVPKIPGVLRPKTYEHVGRLVQLYPNGALVPDDKLEVRARERQFRYHHDRETYEAAVAEHLTRCRTPEPRACYVAGSRAAAAKAERDRHQGVSP
jgi:hypothetical protein